MEKVAVSVINSLEKITKHLKTFCYDAVDTIYTPCDNLQLSNRDLYAFLQNIFLLKEEPF